MGGFYNCPYILRTGKVCNEGCYRLEGCKIHWKSPNQVPCIHPGCKKFTSSVYNACKKHSGKYRSREFYWQHKLAENREICDPSVGLKIDELLLELSANRNEEAGEQDPQIEALRLTGSFAPFMSEDSDDHLREFYRQQKLAKIPENSTITPNHVYDSDGEDQGYDLFG
jgi:hypothetical protein